MSASHCPQDARLDAEASKAIDVFLNSLSDECYSEIDHIRFEVESCVYFIELAAGFNDMSSETRKQALKCFDQFCIADGVSDLEFGDHHPG